MSGSDTTRRQFLQSSVGSAALAALSQSFLSAQENSPDGLPTRPLGKTGEKVSLLCLGGWHIGQAAKTDGEEAAVRLMHQAIDGGMTFFDNCWDYHDGLSEEVMGKAIHDRRDKVLLMTKNCERDYEGSKKCLEDSLRRLQTDHIDLWQFHEMVYDNDPDWVFEKGGIKAAIEAQQAGKVRHIGFTGHKDPRIHLKMIGKPHAWATAQMPINVCDWHYQSFQNDVVPVCLERGIGVIGMKSLGGSGSDGQGIIIKAGLASAEELIRYALSQPVSTLVVGLRNQRDLDQAFKVGRDFEPMSLAEQNALRHKVQAVAGDGRHELFKTTKTFDGPHHRKQHGFELQGS
jgi:uncharacterized protein